ncbi:MAG TPA: hypothetical protein VGR16_13680, partial [Thermomicrobiales bacterium]|nr:hypothetical protein [Thermomicrobiales bacterium]
MIGARWADVAATQVGTWPGSAREILDDSGRALAVDRVIRLDDQPAIASKASRRALQNPDLLLVGTVDGRPALQAADAKFSVETARAKQVSAAVVAGLLTLGEIVTDLITPYDANPLLIDGVFLCPDYLLTRLMFKRKYGVVRTTVRPDQVVLLAAPPSVFFAPLDGAALMPVLAGLDELPIRAEEELMVGLYYFRLARAAIGCGIDATAPLLGFRDRVEVDEALVGVEMLDRAQGASSAFGLILQWDIDVERVRSQRAAVDRVAGLPLRGQEVRELLERHARTTGLAGPSVNQVRRRLGRWYRGALRDEVGPMNPPIADLNSALDRLARVAREVARHAEREAMRII